jgi:hypothetical protein
MIIWYGHVSADESISHLLITDLLEESLITIDNPFEENSKIDLSLEIAKNSNKSIEIINGTPLISIDVFVKSTIQTSGKNFDYTTSKNIEIVEQEAENYLENLISNYLYKLSKDFNADVFNFQSMYAKQCLTTEDMEKIHFKDIYKDSFFNVNVQVEISSTQLFDKE